MCCSSYKLQANPKHAQLAVLLVWRKLRHSQWRLWWMKWKSQTQIRTMPTMPLSPGQTPSVAVNVGAGGSVNSVTHPNEYKRLARFMKSQRNTHLVEMGKMWNKSLSDKNKLLKEWISHGENADKIEASLLFVGAPGSGRS